MNTTFVSVAAVAAILIILAIVVWKVTHKNPDIVNVELPEITPEEIAKAAEEAEEEKSEEVIQKGEEPDEEEDEEPVQTVEEYVAEVASKLVDSEGSLTSSKLETEGQDTVLVISDKELAEANKKFEESLKIIGINPATGCYTPENLRKTEKTVKPVKEEPKKTVKKDPKKDTKKKPEKKEEKKKETVKVNKSGRPIKKIEKKPAGKKNNDARQNKAVNGKKNKKKTNKKKV